MPKTKNKINFNLRFDIKNKVKKIKIKKILINVFVSLVSLLIFFLLIEGILSLFNIGNVKKFKGWGYNPDCCGDLRPNQEILAEQVHGHPYLIKTNSLGLRNDQETTLNPQKARILALGDSFTFGAYTNNQETWPAYLEKNLGKDFEVLNAGICRYSIKEELAYLKEKGYQLKPDLVVLQFLANDITDLEKNLHKTSRRSFLDQTGFIYTIFNFFRDRSHFLALILEAILEKEAKNINPQLERLSEESQEIKYQTNLNHPLYKEYESYFNQLVKFSQKNDIKLMVVLIPELNQAKNIALNNPNQFINGLCQKYQIPYLDLHLPFYYKNSVDVLYLTPWNNHLSKHGNQLVAEEIEKYIIKKNLLNTK